MIVLYPKSCYNKMCYKETATSEVSDEMPQNVAFHQGLH